VSTLFDTRPCERSSLILALVSHWPYRRLWQLVLIVLMAGLTLLLWPRVVQAATAVYTDAIPMQQTDYQHRLTVPQFDPARGTLTRVELALAGRLEGSVTLESLDAQPSVIDVSMAGRVLLAQADGLVLNVVQPQTSRTVNLRAFDGQLDFAGVSGRNFQKLIALSVADSKALTNPSELAPFTGTGVVTLQVTAEGKVTGSGAGNLALNYVTTAAAEVEVRYIYQAVINPAIELKKYTNGADADQPTGPLIQVGQPVTWTYIVRNTGDQPLVDITLVDDREGTITCPKTALAVGETMTCVATGVAELGQYKNTAVVTGQTPADPAQPQQTVSDSDPSHYYGIPPATVCVPGENGEPTLPELQYLGQGGATYQLPGGFTTFVVKKSAPFRFEVHTGVDNGAGVRIYTPASSEERIWACAGNCTFVPTLRQIVTIGQLGPGLSVSMAVIDDDDDDRINAWIANGDTANPVQRIDDQTMVQYLLFDIPFEANWGFHARDSLGLVSICITPTAEIRSASLVGNGVAAAQADDLVATNALFLPMVRR